MNPEILTINQHKSEKYPARTYYNTTSADVTLAMAVNLDTAGELLTKRAAENRYIGFKLTDSIDDVVIARQLFAKMNYVTQNIVVPMELLDSLSLVKSC